MLPRSALLERLGRTPLTVVRAPGGSGKTVLLAQWASARSSPGAWVTVEPDIGSRASFWNAVLDIASAAGLGVPAALEDGSDRDALRRDLLRAFRTVDAFVLVIDDAHELSDPLVVDDLVALLRACPALVVLVGTRARGELEAPRHRLTLDVTVVEPEELVLSLDEVGLLVGSDGSNHGRAAELLEASGGNPLLLRAILGGARGRAGAPRATMSDHLRHLFESRDRELAAFASVTAVPDDVDVTFASQLSGMSAARVGSLLDLLENEGLVMRRETSEGVRHRYHPLVREVLRDELRRERPDHDRRASLLASAEAESRRQFLPALRHAVDAGDYARASDVCLHGGITLLRSRGAAAILQRVPFRYVARLPFLAIVLGLAANARGERLKALELLALALGASRAGRGRQRVAERVGLALVESVVLRITGRADESAAAARRMVSLLEDAAPGDLEEIAEQEGPYRYQGALSLFRAGSVLEARLAADRVGVSASALALGKPETLAAASLIAAVDAGRGECRAASAVLEVIDASTYAVELRDGYMGSLAHLAHGILDLESADPDAAEQRADLLRDRANLEHGMLFVVLRALTALWRGRPEVGLRVLDARESVDRPRARLSAQDQRLATAVRIVLHAALGQLGPAHVALRTLDRGTDPVARVLDATLSLLEQRPELVLEKLSGRSVDAGPRLQAASELLIAAASLRLGDRDVAEAALRRFLATSGVHGIHSPVVLVPRDHRAALWELAQQIGADADILERLSRMPAPFRPAPARATLTRREADVLEKLAETSGLAEIAAALSVSANTVKTQVRTLYRKLGVTSRDEALRLAYLQGLLERRD